MAIKQPITNRPTRKLLPQGVVPAFDSHGFLRAGQDGESFEQCFDVELALLIAPPWMGKSFVSRQLLLHLEAIHHSESTPFGKYVHRTDFEQDFDDDIFPSWWTAWLANNDRACWIIDAVDEDGRAGSRGTHKILNALDALTPARRKALCVFMFVRENEIPKKVNERLTKAYGDPQGSGTSRYRVLRLASLDEASARDLAGGDEPFERICRLISLNKLQSIAGYPAVIEALSRYSDDVAVSDVQVWKDVLLTLMADRNSDSVLTGRRTPLELQFRAAARLAVLLTFGDAEAVGEADSVSGRPSIDALIPLDHPASQVLNASGRDVLRSGIFRRTIQGFQFAQHHVQQWLAAFGAAGLSLTQLRPLLSDSSGKALEIHRGVMGLLLKTSAHQAVKDWIIEQHGGIPPRSDAAPWNLAQSVATLDRLQAIARTTEWGLSLWSERGLNFLVAPGLGQVLATRLADPTLSSSERGLILDVALATDETAAVPPAISIVLDNSADPRLRDHAATLVIVLGKKGDWLRVASELPKSDDNGGVASSIRSSVVLQLFDEGIWDFATTVRELPEYDTRSSLLQYRLENAMSVTDARTLLMNVDVRAQSAEFKTHGIPSRRSPRGRLIVHAIDLIVGQESLSADDFKVLHPIALAQFREEWRSADVARVVSVISKSRDARRALFRDVVAQSPIGSEQISGNFWELFDASDLDWILSIAEEDNGGHPWIWTRLLEVASWRHVPADVRERVRGRGRVVVPTVVERVDKEKAAAEEREQEFERLREEFEKKEVKATFQLPKLADDTLADDAISLCEKMRRLSWFCLSEKDTRPTNVIGKWEDLGVERQQRVLELCERALRECDPAPIPTGNSYSLVVVYEAYCFARVAELRKNTYFPDDHQIEKWLQSTLVTSITRNDPLVLQCHSAAPLATESVLTRELRRCLASEPQIVHWIDSLPQDIWTPSFSQAVAKEAEREQYKLTGRRELLRTLLIRSKPNALPVATAWLKSVDTDARIAAVDLLILTEPGIVWEEFRKQITEGGSAAFLKLPDIHGRHHTIPVPLTSWPTAYIEELYEMLMSAFPPESDPKREAGVSFSWGPDDFYRELRSGLTPLLFKRRTQEDLAALDRLSSKYESTGKWYATMRAQMAAGNVLEEFQSTVTVSPGSSAVPFAKVARVLDVAVYRLLRTPADLQAVLLEELANIRSDAKEHLSCLYYPRKAQRAGVQKALQEDALQAYFYCRLTDRLRGRVLESGTKVILNREALTTKDQRLDIKVQAPTIDNLVITIVIELKWSNHPTVSTSLRTQLGDEYLINGNLTHGIYLVGWSVAGRWRDASSPAPQSSTPEGWYEALTGQSRDYTANHPTIFIEPIIINLEWPSGPAGLDRRGRKRNATPSSARAGKGRARKATPQRPTKRQTRKKKR